MYHCTHCNCRLKKKNKFCPVCGMVVIREDGTKTIGSNEIAHKALLFIVIMLVIAAGLFLVLGGLELFSDKVIDFSDNTAAIAEASQSVVKLNCYDRNDELYTTGSGFACFADDVIVTNYHVIEGNVYRIRATSEDGRGIEVKYVLAADQGTDIAILITAVPHGLPLLPCGNSEGLQKGEKVVAIGSPLGLLNSVSTGVFSGYVDDDGTDVLQFTAPISSGSSGGALFNNSGEVLGITFASFAQGQNVNLAVPINLVAHTYSTSDSSKKLTLKTFYHEHIPTYTVDEALELGNRLKGTVFHIKGFFQSYMRSSSGGYYDEVWCTLFSDYSNEIFSGNHLQIGYISSGGLPFEMLKNIAHMESLNTGDLIKVRCEYAQDNSGFVMISIISNLNN